VAGTTKQDSVRDLQRTLYRAAKADPGRRFHVLYDKVYRRDVLERAWELVRANYGAAGIDKQTIADIEQVGVDWLLDELATVLREGRWRPLPARRVFIPKLETMACTGPGVMVGITVNVATEGRLDRSAVDPIVAVAVAARMRLDDVLSRTLSLPGGLAWVRRRVVGS